MSIDNPSRNLWCFSITKFDLILYFNYVWALATYQGTKGTEAQVGYITLTAHPVRFLVLTV